MPDSRSRGSRLNTAPEWDRAALITIDVQRDFAEPGASAEVPGTMAAIPAMADVLDAFRTAGRPIIHMVRMYRPDGSNADRCRRQAIKDGQEIVAPDTEGAQIVDDLLPRKNVRLDAETLLNGDIQHIGPGEVIIYKPRWGGFYGTPLHSHLNGLGVSTVVICGCNYPNCPRTTIYEASERDYRIVLVTDGTSGLYERALDEMENIGVHLTSSRRVATAVETTATAPGDRRSGSKRRGSGDR